MLSQGPDEFSVESANNLFFVNSMYRDLVHYDMPVDDNKIIWKMNILLKLNFLRGIFGKRLF